MGADKRRPEELINYYAKTRVGVRKIANATGFFALLWSTVVLLGGFVSLITVKEFWFLSTLSLIMASKLLELDTKTLENFVAERNILRLSKGQDQLQLEDANRWKRRMIIFTVSTAVAVKIILTICLYAIFVVSPHVALAISVARLVQRDYGEAGGDASNKAKLSAALIIFYVLVIFQSLSFLYHAFLTTYDPWISVSKQYGFGIWGPKIVGTYRTKTRIKCHKDGVLPMNWNLITFSVGLLESASQKDRLWGARVLDTFTGKGMPIRQELLSSSQAPQNLIDMIIGPTRTEDNPEIRERATRIVADLASELRIAQFPDALRSICCLFQSCNQYSGKNSKHTLDENSQKVSVETLEDSHHQEDAHLSLAITEQTDPKQVVHLASGKLPKRRSWIETLSIQMTIIPMGIHNWERYFGDKYYYSYVSRGTKELISQGLVILERLTQDEDNCAEIIKHQRLLSKITLPLSYHDLLNNGWNHTLVGKSLTVVSRLISAGPTDDTTWLCRDMSRNMVAIHNLMLILEFDSEGARELREQAIEILTELAFDDSFRKLAFDESTGMMEMFVKTLWRIFVEDKDINVVVAKEDEVKDKRVRRKAGEALARLLSVPSARDNTAALTSSTNGNAVDVLPKHDVINLLARVVDQILSSEVEKAADVDVVTLAGSSNNFHVELVVESQPPNNDGASQSSTQENEEQPEDRKLLAAMLSLTVAICNKNVISGDNFTRAIPDDEALVKKVKEILEMNKDAMTEGWRIVKLVCQVVIAMAQLKPSCIREFNGHGFKQALSKALETMSDVDNCMIFAGNDRQFPARSLTSLVKEALELLAQEQGDIPV